MCQKLAPEPGLERYILAVVVVKRWHYLALGLGSLGLIVTFFWFWAALEPARLWLSVEAPSLRRQLGFSLLRFGRALVLGTLLGVSIGFLLRLSRDVEGYLTPWLLTALALPWLAMIILLNLMAGLTETAALWVGALAATPQIAYGFRPLGSARTLAAGFLSGYRLIFFAIALAEILGSDTGVGSQIRFFFLFWNPPRLSAYLAILLLLWLAVEVLTRLLGYLIHARARRLAT